jgi:hypothetical protein
MVSVSNNSPSFEGHSCGRSFDEPSGVQNLSDLADGALLAGSSQSGGNTISAKSTYLQTGTPGSVSEQTAVNLVGEDLDDVSHVTDPLSGPKFDGRRGGADGDPFGLA